VPPAPPVTNATREAIAQNNTMARVTPSGQEQMTSALVLTFDNLGEASALERGEQPTALGRDPSVTVALPWLLDELDRHGLTATFFVEAVNCELYPDAVREIAARGHELGHHGWAHETWRELSAQNERDALARGIEAFARLGLRPRGFRPPGGELTERTPALLREHGFEWCSPAGRAAEIRDGLAYVPFDWELVDAYHLMDSFAALRASRGDPEARRSPGELADWLTHRLAAGGSQTLILHPFLMLDDAWSAGVVEVLSALAELARDGLTSVVPGGVFAAWLRGALTS
jgi:peptidoglycan/xylan/chitin deacetylase (PgdA/CDA1 family)